ncbi:hypothetical protein [Streptomyces sp. HD]|uniref:hypothetical protein n=1 Tax=Streptomyces sp. HD TaxID=3020892 RepID=UPI00232BCFBC|nr:hypothetical protein [Streptomyces sp. HD]MDC0769252.1 hypothetical protein [Streptomyces sp. HD]
MATLDYRTSALINKARDERERRRSGRSRMSALIASAVVGGIGLLLALTVGGDPKEPPACDDQTMTRGDTCVISSRGGSGSYSYEEMIDRRESSDAVWRGIGVGLAGICPVLLVIAMVGLDPSTPWGAPVAGPCPRCGKPNRREKKTTYSVSQGRTTSYYTGIVTLCACGFGAVRRP